MSSSVFSGLMTDSVTAAKRLLGSYLIADIEDTEVRFKIVETEAYDQSDPASHSFRGISNRTRVMFGPPGFLYVYFTYGMHYCCNVVVGEEGYGAAALIRAVEPIDYVESLSYRRGGRSGVELTNGPAKLCQALGITTLLNGHDLSNGPLRLKLFPPLVEDEIVTTTRIGIRSAVERRWRFYIKHNPYVSRFDKSSAAVIEATEHLQL